MLKTPRTPHFAMLNPVKTSIYFKFVWVSFIVIGGLVWLFEVSSWVVPSQMHYLKCLNATRWCFGAEFFQAALRLEDIAGMHHSFVSGVVALLITANNVYIYIYFDIEFMVSKIIKFYIYAFNGQNVSSLFITFLVR